MYIKNDKLNKEWEDNKLKCELRNVLSINEGHSNGHKREIQAEWLACRKSQDPILNAVLLFSKTVCWEDAGSKIQFSLISVYKKMGLTTSKSWFGWKHGL